MRKQKWLRSILVCAIAIFAASIGLSRALRTSAARRYLIAHLEASFGRPVDVGRFDFSLLDGARLEAHSVTIAEDPQFGNEYFLRAETLTAGLRWAALLAGRFEFGSLFLQRPSLNLVRNADGEWNIERWLPPASPAASRPGFVGPPAMQRGPAARLYRIDVDAGRINFKQRGNKSPFALLNVSGRVEQDQTGRWILDVQAQPMRAGVELQQIGTVRLRGSIAGTSARLQPAELSLTWRAVSVADALRLARQYDYGMRGNLSVDLSARVAPATSSANHFPESGGGAQWSISGVARLTGIHGWRLPGRGTDPAVNLSLEAGWRLGDAHAQIQKLQVETRSSHLQSTGDLDWGHGFYPQLHIESSSVALGDVLAWYRALRPDVAEDLRAEGTLGVDATVGGWPPQLRHGAITSIGGTLAAPSLPAPLQIGAMNVSISRGGLDLAPTEISFSPVPPEADNTTRSTGSAAPNTPKTFMLRASIFPAANGEFHWPPAWNFAIEGGTPRVQDWVALSASLAQRVNTGWTAAGGLALKMRGAHKTESPGTLWLGSVDFRGLTVSPDYVNQPLSLPSAHIEFTQLQRTITLSAAEALGATWSGNIVRKISDGQWTFDLSADHLDATELDRWLGPRARPRGLLARFTSLGAADAASPEPNTDTAITRMAAHGRLRAAEIVVAPLRFEKFDSLVDISGRTITISKAQADFFGGKLSGIFDARLVTDPSYHFQGRFDRVDLSQLGDAVSFLNNRVAGSAYATLSLSAHGIGRENLAGSLEGNGTLDARNAEVLGLDFSELIPGGSQDSAPRQLKSIQGSFHIGGGGISLTDFVLDDSQGRYRADGRIDFSHSLNVHIRPSIFEAAASAANPSPPSFVLSGTVEDPKLSVPSVEPKPAARSGTRRR